MRTVSLRNLLVVKNIYMECYRYSISNLGSEIISFNYQKCNNYQWEYNVELLPNESKNIWALEGSFNMSKFYDSSVEIEIERFTTIPECAILTTNSAGRFYYDPFTNTQTLFDVPNSTFLPFGDPFGMAHNNSNLWLLYATSNTSRFIREWAISGNPPYTVSNNYRTLNFPQEIYIFNNGTGLAIAPSNNLVFVDSSWKVWELVVPSIGQSLMSANLQFSLPANSSWCFMVTSDNKFLNVQPNRIDGVMYLIIKQYDYSTGTLESEIVIVAQNQESYPESISQFRGKTYIFCTDGIYQVDMTPPYSSRRISTTWFKGSSSTIPCSPLSFGETFNISLSDGFGPYPAVCDGVSGPFPNSAFVNTLFWPNITKFYSDSSLTTGFNGNNLWYGGYSSNPNFVYNSCTYQIDSSGNVIDTYCC